MRWRVAPISPLPGGNDDPRARTRRLLSWWVRQSDGDGDTAFGARRGPGEVGRARSCRPGIAFFDGEGGARGQACGGLGESGAGAGRGFQSKGAKREGGLGRSRESVVKCGATERGNEREQVWSPILAPIRDVWRAARVGRAKKASPIMESLHHADCGALIPPPAAHNTRTLCVAPLPTLAGRTILRLAALNAKNKRQRSTAERYIQRSRRARWRSNTACDQSGPARTSPPPPTSAQKTDHSDVASTI
jgi:hypothetical protein